MNDPRPCLLAHNLRKIALFAAATAVGALLSACSPGGGNATDGGGGGITGTGVTASTVGTVTGFGSVVVSGVHYTARSGATVLVEGKSGATEADLQPGMTVVISGDFNSASRSGRYAVIEYRSDLKGQVQSVDLVKSSFTVLGQTVLVDAATIFDGLSDLSLLATGTTVEVSGSNSLSGQLLATRVYRLAAPDSQVRIKGSVTATGSGTFTINGQQIAVTAQTTLVSPLTATEISAADSRFLEVTGSLSGSTIIAERIERLDLTTENPDGVRLDLKGIVVSVSGSSLLLNSPKGQLTVNSSGAVVTNGTLGGIQPGTTLEAAGFMSGGILVAATIALEQENDIRLAGDISGIDLTAKSLTVNGISAMVSEQTVFRDSSSIKLRNLDLASLGIGDHIETGGYLDSSVAPARLILTRVERFDPTTASFIQGPVSQLAPQLQILGLTVITGSSTSFRNGATDLGSLAAFMAQIVVNTTVVRVKGGFTPGPPPFFSAVELEIQP